MKQRVRFLLNGKPVELEPPLVPQLTLDWLRHQAGLTGTKEGCREGDCGACMVILGQRPLQIDGGSPASKGAADPIEWLPVTSCLLAVEELDGKHLITIEGLAEQGPTTVMKALHEENASQCGFCSPGVVIALTARILQGGPLDEAALKRALEGNLCRCTGYDSLHRSAKRLASELRTLPGEYKERLTYLVSQRIIPESLAKTMYELPAPFGTPSEAGFRRKVPGPARHILPLGGGTDWFVKHDETEAPREIDFIDTHTHSRYIKKEGPFIRIGAAVTMGDFFANPLIREAVPDIETFESLVASPGIRSRATLTGNIANASPVADMTAMLLALDAQMVLLDTSTVSSRRTIALDQFFLSYKKTAAGDTEELDEILLPLYRRDSPVQSCFNFEKAAKRDRLDIAAVNTACWILFEDTAAAYGGVSAEPGRSVNASAATSAVQTSGTAVELSASGPVIRKLRISAGGVGPVPMLLAKPAKILEGKVLTTSLVQAAADGALAEINPISDVRGSAEYRREALRRLILAHFIKLFPHIIDEEVLLQ
jgi:xanthine dehydrogenase small subunit